MSPYPIPIDPLNRQGNPSFVSRHRGCLIATLLVGGLFTLLLCAGLGASLWMLNRAGVIVSNNSIEHASLEVRRSAYIKALDQYLAGQSTIDPEVKAWIDQVLSDPDVIDDDITEVPHDEANFLRAIQASPLGKGLTIGDRVLIKLWLSQGSFPLPDTLDHHTLIDVDRPIDSQTGRPGDFATASLVFYGDGSASFTSRWYLYLKEGAWRLYDWERLEFGRRISDEWANFAANQDDWYASGYDEAIVELSDILAEDNGWQRRDEQAQRILEATRRKVLHADRPVLDLRTSWGLQSIGADQQAIDLLEEITEPSVQWGVLTTKMVSLIALERTAEAISVAKELLAIAPNHPNALDALAVSLVELERGDEAIPHFIKILSICPEAQASFNQLVDLAGPEELDDVLRFVFASKNSQGRSETLLYRLFLDDDAPNAFARWREMQANCPEVPPEFWELVEASELLRQGEIQAAESRLRSVAMLDSSQWNKFARKEYRSLLEKARRFNEVIAFEGVDRIISTLAFEIYDDDSMSLEPAYLEAIQQAADFQTHPWVDLLVAAVRTSDMPEQAIEPLTRLLDRHIAQPDAFATDDEIADFGIDWARSLLIDAFVHSHRAIDAIERFSISEEVLDPIVSFYWQHPDAHELATIVERLEQADAGQFKPYIIELRAVVAHNANEFQRTDELLRQAEEAWEEQLTTSEDRYQINWRRRELPERRAICALLHRMYEPLVANPGKEPNLVIGTLTAYASALGRLDALEAADQLLSKSNQPEFEVVLEFVDANIMFHRELDKSVQRLTDAIKQDRSDEEPLPYHLTYRIPSIINRILLTGRIDLAESLLTLMQSEESGLTNAAQLKLKANVELAKGSWDSLVKTLSAMTQTERDEWIDKECSRRFWDQATAANPKLSDLVVPEIQFHQTADDILLMDSEPWELSEASILKAIGDDFATSVSIKQLENGSAQIIGWIVASSDRRWLITTRSPEINGYGDSRSEIRQTSKASATAIFVIPLACDTSNVGIADYQNRWELARRLVRESTVVVYDGRSNIAWLAPNRDELAWDHGIPITKHSRLNQYFFPDIRSNTVRLTNIGNVREALDEQRLECRISPTRFFGGLELEQLKAELVKTDQNNYVYVRLKQTSQLDPYFCDGVVCRVHPSWIKID